MPALTRRRSPDAREECWRIYFGDVHVSTIALTDAGTPTLALSVAQALNDAGALAKITNTTYRIAVSDTAGNVASHIDALNEETRVGSITLATNKLVQKGGEIHGGAQKADQSRLRAEVPCEGASP